MHFELIVNENTPMTETEDINAIAKNFLENIGITSEKAIEIFTLFLKNQEKYINIEELTEKLKSHKPIIYNHLNKFRQLQILEDSSLKEDKEHKKGYRLRFGNLSFAWKFTEIYVEGCLIFYRKAIEEIQKNFIEKKVGKDDFKLDNDARNFSIRIIDINIDFSNPKDGLKKFLIAIGLMQNEEDKIPFKIFEYFLKKIEKPIEVGEISFALKISEPTAYRHLNKLLALDILDRIVVENKDKDVYRPAKKLYRIKYGNILKAWNFTESHVKVAMENYRKTVEHLQELVEKELKK